MENVLDEIKKKVDYLVAQQTKKEFGDNHIFTVAEIEKMTSEQWRRNEAEIMQQYREGKIK